MKGISKTAHEGCYTACSCWWNELPPAKPLLPSWDQSSFSTFSLVCETYRSYYTTRYSSYQWAHLIQGSYPTRDVKFGGLLRTAALESGIEASAAIRTQVLRIYLFEAPDRSWATGMKSCIGRGRSRNHYIGFMRVPTCLTLC